MEKQKQDESFETGTTTVGVVGKDCVVLAGDKQATLGNLKASKEAQKVFKLDNKIGLTIAGSVGDAQKLIRLMKSELKLKRLEVKKLSVKGAATLLANVLQSSKAFPFMNQFIMGGVGKDGTKVYDLDPLGGLMKHSRFTSTGSGSPTAYGVLEDSFEEEMEKEDAIALAVRSIKAASERDINSGEGISVGVVDGEEEFGLLSPEEVEEYM